MQTQIRFRNDISVVELPARLLMADTPTVRSEITQLIRSGRNQVVMDLSKVELLDSSGLSVLISALKQAQAQGGDVVLAEPSEDVRALIDLTRMHQIFAIYEDRGAAIAALS